MICRSTCLAAVLYLILLCGGRAAQAGRVVHFEVLKDEQVVLCVMLLDQGEANFDAAWNYLKTRPLKNPAAEFVLSAADTERLKTFKIESSSDDPLRATLTGKYRIFCRYAGDARTDELRLVRKDEKSPWQLDPQQVDELAKLRTIDRAMRTREQVDAATKSKKE